MKLFIGIVFIILYVGIGMYLETLAFMKPAYFAAYGAFWCGAIIVVLHTKSQAHQQNEKE